MAASGGIQCHDDGPVAAATRYILDAGGCYWWWWRRRQRRATVAWSLVLGEKE